MNCNLPTAAQEQQINAYDWLVRHFEDLVFSQDHDAIDEYVEDCTELNGVQFEEWVDEVWNDAARLDVLCGRNLHQHALECAQDYVDYLLDNTL